MMEAAVVLLSILQWNAQSLVSHGPQLKQHLSKLDVLPDIICVQETFLWPNCQFKINGYISLRQDRANFDPTTNNSRRGGCAIFVKSNLTYKAHNLPKLNFEANAVKIFNGNQRALTIFNVYNRGTASVVDYKKMIENTEGPLIICGDFNSHHEMWGSRKTDLAGTIIESFIDDADLVVLNNGKATRVNMGNLSYSVLDLTLVTASLSAKCDWDVYQEDTLGSDHFPVYTQIHFNPLRTISSRVPRWKFRSANWNEFSIQCENEITEDLLSTDIEMSNQNLTSKIIGISNKCIGKSSGKFQPRVSQFWWNKECEEANRARHKAYNKVCRTSLPADLETFRKRRAELQRIVRQVKRSSWRSYISTINRNTPLTTIWSKVKRISGSFNRSPIPVLGANGQAVTNQEKSELLAEQFETVSSLENFPAEFQDKVTDVELEFKAVIDKAIQDSCSPLDKPFTLVELLTAIQKGKNTSPGADDLCYEHFKHMPNSSLEVVKDMINQSWLCGEIPKVWTEAVVIPIPKPGKDASIPSSYRPIALTSNLCKIMERLVSNRLSFHMESNQLLNRIQSGFRKNRSCTDQLIRLQTAAQKAISNQEYMICVFLDIEKAYDMLWRQGLLFKLQSLGVKGRMLKWISSFLSHRTIRVRIGQDLSGVHVIENGTPQGSVISPLLFNIMINDMFDSLPVNIDASQFADDGAFWRRFGNLDFVFRSIQSGLDSVYKWCSKWGFKISISKSVAMNFTKRKLDHDLFLTIGEHRINFVSDFKFLGVYFDRKLTWSRHITYLSGKCSKGLNLLKCVSGTKWGADKSSLLLLYKALILSRLDYGSQVFMNAAKCHLTKLDRVQSKALRIATGAFPTTPIAAMQVECSEPPLAYCRQKSALKTYLSLTSSSDYHSSRDVLNECVEYVMCDWSHGKLPFGLAARQLAHKCKIQDLQLNSPFKLPKSAPWCLTQPSLNTDLASVIHKQMSPIIIKAVASDFINTRYHGFNHIYTDASKDPATGHVGAAFYVPSLEVEEMFRLQDNLSVFAAELTAILMALVWVQNHNLESIIFTDSLAAVQAIHSGANGQRSDILYEILHLGTVLNKAYISCDIVWVPAHVGLHGNERADQLAKSSLSKPYVDFEDIYPVPKDIYTAVNKAIYEQWQNDWDRGNTARHMHSSCPKVIKHAKIRRQNRRDEVILTRLRLGHCGLNAYKHILDNDSSPSCVHCLNNCPETVLHYLVECEGHKDHREELREVVMSKSNNFSLRSILGENLMFGEVQRSVLNFVKNTGKYDLV